MPVIVVLAVLDMEFVLETSLKILNHHHLFAARRNRVTSLPVVLDRLVISFVLTVTIRWRLVNVLERIFILWASLRLVEEALVLRVPLVVVLAINQLEVIVPRWIDSHGVFLLWGDEV
jgi:hypothetical protein